MSSISEILAKLYELLLFQFYVTPKRREILSENFIGLYRHRRWPIELNQIELTQTELKLIR